MTTVSPAVDRASIQATYRLIQPFVRRTPVIQVDAADFGLGSFRLSFKLEHLQHAGSFKTRGAFAHLLTRPVPAAGGPTGLPVRFGSPHR